MGVAWPSEVTAVGMVTTGVAERMTKNASGNKMTRARTTTNFFTRHFIVADCRRASA